MSVAPEPPATPAQKSRKIAVLGSRSVGKSSLCVQFVDNHFVESYYPTIENTFSKEVKYKNQVFQVDIVDTAGQDEFSITDSRHFIGMHGYLIVYSVTSLESFEMAKIIREKILNQLGYDHPPMILVGNKCDAKPEDRQVATESAKELADSAGIPFVEASARYNQNVAKSFEDLVEEIEKAQNPVSEPNKGSKCAIM